jgi:EAL domain-containing protein (putative c-di-GMP-specific phosphodiesterase class I)
MSSEPQLIPEPAPQLPIDPPFTFAFQPIVDAVAREVVGWEALIRGPWGEPAWQVFNQVSAPDLHLFDQTARLSAVTLAGRLGIEGPLHLNLLPQGLDSYPKTILATIEAAQQAGVPANRIVLEVPEVSIVNDRAHFAVLMKDARALGVRLAIDDFGATFASLTLLDDLEPNQIKLDMRLIRGVDRGGSRQAILRAIRRACYDLKIDVIAEGVETLAEYRFLIGQRVRLFQGYLFAKPAFEAFPPAHFPESSIGEAPKPPARATTSRAAASRSKKRA